MNASQRPDVRFFEGKSFAAWLDSGAEIAAFVGDVTGAGTDRRLGVV